MTSSALWLAFSRRTGEVSISRACTAQVCHSLEDFRSCLLPPNSWMRELTRSSVGRCLKRSYTWRGRRDAVRKVLSTSNLFCSLPHLSSKVKCSLHYTWFIVTQSSQQRGGDEFSIRYGGRLLMKRESGERRGGDERGVREESGKEGNGGKGGRRVRRGGE